jgi:hypothetical protein
MFAVYVQLLLTDGMVLIATIVSSTSSKTFCHYYVSYSYSLGTMCRGTLHMGVTDWASKCAHMCKICQHQIMRAF